MGHDGSGHDVGGVMMGGAMMWDGSWLRCYYVKEIAIIYCGREYYWS